MAQKGNNLRTDMADELGAELDSREDGVFRLSQIQLTPALARKFGKPKGRYITVESRAVTRGDKHHYMQLAVALKDALKGLGELDDCLVVGLGNPHLTADSLGNLVMKRLMVTRHIEQEDAPTLGTMSAICPNVLGMTGIESYEIVKGIVSRTKPRCVIGVDSLASASLGRLATAFQVSDAGITPGSGVGNHRLTLSRARLGVPVYSIGVPLVVYASTLVGELLRDAGSSRGLAEVRLQQIGDMVVTPKDIDLLVEESATVIAAAINLAVHPITVDELASLMP